MSDFLQRLDFVSSSFERDFGHSPTAHFVSPGRSELGGNHTDHQGGHVLACAVSMNIVAAVDPNESNIVRFISEGFSPIELDLNDLSIREDERRTSNALIRGIAFRMRELGEIGHRCGFDAYASSDVLEGSGLSSSAAFEVLVGQIFNNLFCADRFSPIEIAEIGQYAENVYFGKPCGLMDQAACAIGGVVAIDFSDSKHPGIQKLELDLAEHGYAICIIDVHADHADLTDEYASITKEMRDVAMLFGVEKLSEVSENEFMRMIPEARFKVGDRAVLRAMHFFADDKRAQKEAVAIKDGDFNAFLRMARESGLSSAMYLQNIYPTGNVSDQSLMLTLALAEKILDGEGAVRVHGGGFGGTAQAFVPMRKLDDFTREMNSVLGEGSCHVLDICPQGARQLDCKDVR